MHRPRALRRAHFIEDLLRRPGAHGRFLGRETGCDVHEPAGRQQVGSRLDKVMSQFAECRIEISTPETPIIMFRVNRMTDRAKDSHEFRFGSVFVLKWPTSLETAAEERGWRKANSKLRHPPLGQRPAPRQTHPPSNSIRPRVGPILAQSRRTPARCSCRIRTRPRAAFPAKRASRSATHRVPRLLYQSSTRSRD